MVITGNLQGQTADNEGADLDRHSERLFKKWRVWFKVLDREVLNLHTQRHIFEQVQEIIRDNPEIHQPNDFNFWMAFWYSSSMSVAVRRQIDRSEDSVSYVRLLEEIRDSPSVLSRARYMDMFLDERYTETKANRDLDRILGGGKSHVDPRAIQEEIDELVRRGAPLRRYVNKRIAHRDHREYSAVPTFRDLNSAIDFIGKLHQKYYEIFEGLSTAVRPEWGYDWKAVFRYPWMNQ